MRFWKHFPKLWITVGNVQTKVKGEAGTLVSDSSELKRTSFFLCHESLRKHYSMTGKAVFIWWIDYLWRGIEALSWNVLIWKYSFSHMLKHLDDHSIMLVYSLLVGTPTGFSLDLFSTARDNCLTPSFGRWRGRLSQCPPSTIRVVPLTYLPSRFT